MTAIIHGKDEVFAAWAASRIPHVGSIGFGPCRAVAAATGPNADDNVLAVFVFHDYQAKYGTCQISMASADPRWATRSTIRAVLAVPFLQYKCHLVWCIVPHTAERTLALTKALGFTREAVLKDRFGKGTHAVIVRMESKDYDKRYFDQPMKAKAA